MENRQKQKTKPIGVIMLLLTAFIWGVAFVAQSAGMDEVGGFTFNTIRMLLGASVLLPFILIRDKINARAMSERLLKERKAQDKKTMRYGIILGIVFCAASNFQQFAFAYTTTGKIAFISALYMFFVPLFGLVIHKKVPFLTWICVIAGFIGLYFLSVNPNDLGGINFGDILTLISSSLFAVHILLIERFAADADGIKLSCLQLIVAGLISGVLMFIFEEPSFGAIGNAAVPLLYAGILSCGLAYTFQIIGQKYAEATVSSLILCMESVFGVLAAAILLHEVLSGREILGCSIMFAAIVFSQISGPMMEKIKERRAKA